MMEDSLWSAEVHLTYSVDFRINITWKREAVTELALNLDRIWE